MSNEVARARMSELKAEVSDWGKNLARQFLAGYGNEDLSLRDFLADELSDSFLYYVSTGKTL